MLFKTMFAVKQVAASIYVKLLSLRPHNSENSPTDEYPGIRMFAMYTLYYREITGSTCISIRVDTSKHIQSKFKKTSKTDGSFTITNSNSVLSPLFVISIDQEHKYFGIF